MPGEEKPYVVMWDYNVGLVRVTPFFKACGYSKVAYPGRFMQETCLTFVG